MGQSSGPVGGAEGGAPAVREAESALRRLGYSRVPPRARDATLSEARFWVQEPGVPRRTYPVFLEEGGRGPNPPPPADRPSIFVVPDEERARTLWNQLRSGRGTSSDPETAILVLGPQPAGAPEAHWHEGIVERRELLEIATGVIVGLFRRASSDSEATGQVDFEEMLQILRQRFHLDLRATLGAESDEDALWLMYQLAMRYSYAPGDASANLHLIVLRPSGPAARLPWFAA